MRKRFTLIIVAALAMLCLAFAACFTEAELPAIEGGWGYDPETGEYFSGEVSGRAAGFGGPNAVGVTIYLVDGFIITVDLDLARETSTWANRVREILPGIITRTNSFNFTDGIVTGPTAPITVRGVREAGRAALLDIPHVYEDDLDF